MSDTETKSPQFLLIFRDSVDSPDISPEEMQAEFAKWFAWSEKLQAVNKYAGGNPLEEPGRVLRGDRGQSVTDGPFIEAKEVLCGYFLVNAADIEEASKIAEECPGLVRGMSVEIRPVMVP